MDSYKNIPEELKGYPNWINWNRVTKDGKATKIPVNPKTGGKAMTNNPSTWGSFEKATEEAEKYSGIGFVFTNTPFVGIDLDHVDADIEKYKQGDKNNVVSEYVDSLKSYTEYSQSGKGIHIIARGKLPGKGYKRGGFEFYDTSSPRFFATTGNIASDYKGVRESQEEITKLHEKYIAPKPKENAVPEQVQSLEPVGVAQEINDDDLLKIARNSKNGKFFNDLYSGKWQGHFSSQSEADISLLNMLAFWTVKDAGRMDSLFRRSGLMREKWERKQSGSTYGNLQIQAAIRDCREVFKSKDRYSLELNFTSEEEGKDLYYLERFGEGIRVNTALLAKYIIENAHFLIVRKNGFDTDILYWYEKGYYGRLSVNEFKGRIKRYIPVAIRKPRMFEEAYKELVTEKSRIKLEDLDTDSRYINFNNGLFDISEKILKPHSPEVLSTIRINGNYNPNAAYPEKWHEYLDFLIGGDVELKAILQEWAGLTISNVPGYLPKKALALYGPNGNNGKSQYINMLTRLIGMDFVGTRDIQDLSKAFAGSDLYGKRALLIDDQRSSDLTDSSIFKSITSGGIIACEFKGKQSFSYQFRGTVAFGCNELPFLTDNDKGNHFFERLLIVPCLNTLSEDQRDSLILKKMLQESEGIALWALEGLDRLIKNGYKFTDSKASEEAVKEYRMKSDSLYRYVTEVYEITGDISHRITKTDFEREYDSWSYVNEISHPIQKKNIRDRAQKIGIKYGKVSNNYYMGLRKRVKG